jgi:hypothetical protein
VDKIESEDFLPHLAEGGTAEEKGGDGDVSIRIRETDKH